MLPPITQNLPAARQTASISVRDRWAAPTLLVLLTVAAYSNSLWGPFLFDDEPSIVHNPTIRLLWPIGPVLNPPASCLSVVGRPLANLTLAINYACGGLDVRGYHAVNLALHILAGLTLYGIVRITLSLPGMPTSLRGIAPHLALTVAALWSVHPLQTESVTYIVQRTEVLAGLFYFMTLFCAIRSAVADSPGAERFWGVSAVAACLCGMGSKEVMVSAPLLVGLYDRVFLCRTFREVWQRRKWLYVGLGATWILLGALAVQSAGRGNSAGFGYGMSSWEYLRTQFGWIVHYLVLTFWPDPLVLDYGNATADSAAEILPYALIVAVLLIGTLLALRRQPWIGLLGVWFFALLAPTSSFVPLVGQTAAEHRMYLPLAAVCTAVVVGGWLLCERVAGVQAGARKLGPLLAAAAIVALACCTWLRNEDYQSELRIWDTVVRARPQNSRGFVGRGVAWRKLGKTDLAIDDFETALATYSRAIEVDPDNFLHRFNRGELRARLGRFPQALDDLDAAIGSSMRYAPAYRVRAEVYEQTSQTEAAIMDYSRVIEIQPKNPNAWYGRARCHFGLKHYAQARADLDESVRLGGQPDPDFSRALSAATSR